MSAFPVLHGRTIKALVMDFDGVHTDGRVWVDAEGRESVACHRRDGHGLALLRERFPELRMAVISGEASMAALKRCQKLDLWPALGVDDKLEELQNGLCAMWRITPADCVYIGDDVNDLECMRAVGAAFCPSDAHWMVRQEPCVTCASYTDGGHGVVRVVCDLLMEGA